jgi:SAM-dependent methyltransferase
MSRCILPEQEARSSRRVLQFVREGRVCRALATAEVGFYRELLDGRLSASLHDAGLIETRAVEPAPDGFDLCVEQEPCVCVAPAQCWPAEMLRDAALFYLQFARRTAAWGIGLSRADYNVLRIEHDLRPRYTDFTSLLPLGRTGGAVPARFNTAMLDPLYLLHEGRCDEARHRMAATHGERESASTAGPTGESTSLIRSQVYRDARAREQALRNRGRFFDLLIAYQREIECLSFDPVESSEKQLMPLEPDAHWRPREQVLYGLLRQLRATSILDLGDEGGWASLVAARFGKRVIRMEPDEASASRLYVRARREELPIVPLVSDLSRRATSEDAAVGDDVVRFRSDVVLACGRVPRLVFKGGLTFETVVTRLARMTRRILVVEFANHTDETVQRLAGGPMPGWYRVENFRRELSRRFRRIDVLPGSHGPERQLLICSDRITETCEQAVSRGSSA